MDRIKRLSYEVLKTHKSKFGEDFGNNKKALDEISIVRSKGLKNKVAGYITKYIKREVRDEKLKQAQIEAAKAQEQEAQMDAETVEEVETIEASIEDETETSEETSE